MQRLSRACLFWKTRERTYEGGKTLREHKNVKKCMSSRNDIADRMCRKTFTTKMELIGEFVLSRVRLVEFCCSCLCHFSGWCDLAFWWRLCVFLGIDMSCLPLSWHICTNSSQWFLFVWWPCKSFTLFVCLGKLSPDQIIGHLRIHQLTPPYNCVDWSMKSHYRFLSKENTQADNIYMMHLNNMDHIDVDRQTSRPSLINLNVSNHLW